MATNQAVKHVFSLHRSGGNLRTGALSLQELFRSTAKSQQRSLLARELVTQRYRTFLKRSPCSAGHPITYGQGVGCGAGL